MRRLEIVALLIVGTAGGCMAGAPGPRAATHVTRGPASADQASAGGSSGAGVAAAPMILDRTDVALGTTVEFRHLPNGGEIQDAIELFALRHVVVNLSAWPQGNADLSRFGALPPEADAIVILPGYPPDRSALDGWNLVRGNIRMVLVVDGPPDSPYVLDDLNRQRHLERVVVRMAHPSRAGFERLQRPLSFVVAAAE